MRPRWQVRTTLVLAPAVAIDAKAWDRLADAVVARLWQCEIDDSRGDEYDAFAQQRSLGMFRAHEGFRGVAFLGDGTHRTVVTLWESAADADALARSPLYLETVEEIVQAGFIVSATPAVVATLVSDQ